MGGGPAPGHTARKAEVFGLLVHRWTRVDLLPLASFPGIPEGGTLASPSQPRPMLLTPLHWSHKQGWLLFLSLTC